MDETTATANTPQDYLNFLMEVLQKVQENPNPQLIYPFWAQNLDKLDDNFRQILDSWARDKLTQVTTEQADSIAADIVNFSNLIAQFPLGNIAANKEIAIAGYKIALNVFTFDAFPKKWAMTQNNLANAYIDRIRGDIAGNLEVAITCYREALKVRTFELFPYEWAMTQNNLSEAYRNRIGGDKADNLEQAIVACHEALKIRTFDTFPYEWAMTQNNLANAYLERIKGDKADNLEKAITAYTETLKVYTFEAFPQKWAMMQNNLAISYSKRIRGDKADNLEKAITAYNEALKVYTFEAFPQDWAKIQNNLANTYRERIRGDKAENLERAITAYHQVLKVRTFEVFPQQWANTQNNLANAYRERIRGDKAENLEQAIVAYHEALKIRTFDTFPYEWAMTQNNLAAAYSNRIRGDKTENLEKAIASYHNALTIRTKEADPLDCLLTARNLAILHYDEKQWQSATEAYHIAIEAVENARVEALNPHSRQEVLSNAIGVFYRIVQAHLNLNQPDKALEYIERSKARNLVELMTQKNLKPQGVDRATIEQWDELRQRVVNEQIRLQSRSINQNISSSDKLMPYVSDDSHLQEYQQALDNFIEQKITPIDPTFKLTQKVEPIPFKDIQDLIDEQTAILEWYITEDKIIAFIVSSKELIPPNLPSKGGNNARVKVWQSTAEDLQNLLNWKDEYLNLYEHNKNEWIKTLDSRLNNLSEILHLDRVLDLVPESCNQLILVPHYFLHIFPLHTLPLKNGKSLYQCFSKGVGYAPSCQLLKLVQERKSQRQEEFNHLFAIHNPTRPDIKPLLGSNLEIARISQHFDLQNSIILAECQASETMLEQRHENLKSTHCLHFACHGKFNSKSPLDSALLLADPEGNLGESANLTLAEIFEKLNLQKCRLVTLSACESGMIDPTVISDEYIGIPSGFLFAGSLSVVSTLWTVDPLATTLFMTKFYQNLQCHQGCVIIAANKAQTWLRNLTSKKLARIKDSQKFQQLLEEVFENQKRDGKKFKDLLEAAVKRQPYPFANPYYWTAFIATGI
jgi:CHAT domain-containing protein